MRRWMLALCIPPVCLASSALAQTSEPRMGTAAFSDWQSDAPGVRRLIRPSDLPAPPTGTDPEKSVGQPAKIVPPPQGALPKVPDGFAVQVFAGGFNKPRTLRVAPNADFSHSLFA